MRSSLTATPYTAKNHNSLAEGEKLIYAKDIRILSALALPALVTIWQLVGVHTASGDELATQIDFRRHFHCYNCNIDWDALSDPNNNVILNACLAGADLDKLQKLHLKDLHTRLESLQQGNLIEKTDRNYHLAFPAIVDARRVWFRNEVERIASQMWPCTEKIVRNLNPHLKDCKHMTYHVVWSLVMDGNVAWRSLEEALANKLAKDVSLSGIHWLIYPQHDYSAGTNTYVVNDEGLASAITWTHTTPSPVDITARLGPYSDQLIQSVLQSRPLQDSQAIKALSEYGLADADGSLQIYIVYDDSPAFREIAFGGMTFAIEAFKHMNVQVLAEKLGTSPKGALVITYHELCYELLKHLAAAGTVEIPEIARRANAPTKQVQCLISFAIMRNPDAMQQQLKSKLQDLIHDQN